MGLPNILITGKRGFVNGCFDVLHYGHLKMLEEVSAKVDYLMVAIDSDDRIRENKGLDRPYNNQHIRGFFLESLRYVDKVAVFASDEELEFLVKEFSPDLMVVGSDYEGKKVIGSEHAKKLEFFKKIDGYSTTKILQDTFGR